MTYTPEEIQPVPQDGSLHQAEFALCAEVKDWIRAAIWRQTGVPWRGIHDELDWAGSMIDYYLLTGDESVKAFLYERRDCYRQWADDNQYDGHPVHFKPHYRHWAETASSKNMHHGFPADGTDFNTHTFEHYGLMAELWRMDPDDPVNREIVLDVAHHIGNCVDGVPDWYDYDKHAFRSHWLGTVHVRDYPPYDTHASRDHRIAPLALTAYEMTGDQKYLDWTNDYAGGWADRVLAATDRVQTVILFTDPADVTDEMIQEAALVGSGTAYAAAKSNPDSLYAGLSAYLGFILTVHALSPEDRYLQAVLKGIDIVERTEGAAAALATKKLYRQVTGDTRFDEEIDAADAKGRADLLAGLDCDAPMLTALTLEKTGNEWNDFKIVWGYRDDDRIVECDMRAKKHVSPAAFMQGYAYTGEARYAVRAMQQATTMLNIVVRSFRDGWEHGCAGGQFIHGYAGRAMGVLAKITALKSVRYFDGQGTPGLPENVAAMLIPETNGDAASLSFFNATDKELTVQTAPADAGKDSSPTAVPLKPRTPSGPVVSLGQ